MIRISNLYLKPDYNNDNLIKKIASELGCKKSDIKNVKLFKRSIDARKKNDVHFLITADAELHNEQKVLLVTNSKKVTQAKPYTYIQPVADKNTGKTVVAGAGPAGLFAALILARAGAEVVLIERGKPVNERTRDVESFWSGNTLDINSNVQFGEGGAGTFSDGKLTTGTKDKRVRKVFEEFVSHGAPQEILYNAKPHIGTDMLKSTVRAIREEIVRLGGTVYFQTQLTDIKIDNNRLRSVTVCQNGTEKTLYCDNLIIAIGHSARDTFKMLKRRGFAIEPKPFAVGARIEHLREKIDASQYGSFAGMPSLGAAPYKLSTHLKNGRGVYTFCMCPGGVVVAAASEKNTVVTNGMSYFARDMQNSNSALLVGVNPSDYGSDDVLAGMYFQQKLEEKAFLAGGGDYSAPVQRVGDFLKGNMTSSFGEVLPSYRPSVKFSLTENYLPQFITDSMKQGIIEMDKHLHGFADNDALLTGIESRSSSPIRILREQDMQAVGFSGIYPCGEGAGYAGGIVSAAVDGIKCAEKILENKMHRL